MKKMIAVLFSVICLSICFAAEAESLYSFTDGAYLVSDGEFLFVVKDNGEVFSYMSELDADPVTAIDLENDYPTCSNSGLTIYQKAPEGFICDNDRLIEFPSALTGGGEYWWVSALQHQTEYDYFLFHDVETEDTTLCRYDGSSKRFLYKGIQGLNDYFLQEDGTTYAVTYDHEKNITTVIRVDWDGSDDLEAFSLQGRYEHFQIYNGVFIAVYADESCFVQIVDGQIKTSVFSAFASSVMDSALFHEQFWVLGSPGLYTPDWSAVTSKTRVLRISGSGPNPVDQEFLLQHPDVRIEYVPNTAYEKVGMYNAIITGIVDLDVCTIDTSIAAEAFLSKGYTLDLSVSPVLLEKGQAMYQPIKEFIFRDNMLLMIPYSIRLDNVVEYQPASCQLAGISVNDLPDTIEELLDIIINWDTDYGLTDAADPVVPILFDESAHKTLLYQVIDSYVANSRHRDIPLSFDTDTFRRLLEKARIAADAAPIQTYDYNPARLFVQVGREVPGIYSVVFPLDENESPKYLSRVSGWAVCADAQEPELAIEYITFRMSKLTDATSVLLYDQEYEAIEREDFPSFLADWQAELEKLYSILENDKNPITQRTTQEQISIIEDRITNPPDSFRYAITTEEIQFYQNEVIPNIEFTYGNPITNSEPTSIWAHTLIKQYVEGLLNDDTFIRELDQRMWMMQMESGE